MNPYHPTLRAGMLGVTMDSFYEEPVPKHNLKPGLNWDSSVGAGRGYFRGAKPPARPRRNERSTFGSRSQRLITRLAPTEVVRLSHGKLACENKPGSWEPVASLYQPSNPPSEATTPHIPGPE